MCIRDRFFFVKPMTIWQNMLILTDFLVHQKLFIKLIVSFCISVNPLTGELIGCPGAFVPDDTPKKAPKSSTRVPPGGYTTPLW